MALPQCPQKRLPSGRKIPQYLQYIGGTSFWRCHSRHASFFCTIACQQHSFSLYAAGICFASNILSDTGALCPPHGCGPGVIDNGAARYYYKCRKSSGGAFRRAALRDPLRILHANARMCRCARGMIVCGRANRPMLLSVACGNGPFAVRMSAAKEAQIMLNENIKRARKAKGLSQEELAAKPTATGRFWSRNYEKQVLDRLRSGALLGMGAPLIFTYSVCTAGSAPPGPRPPSGTEPGLRPGPRPQWWPGARLPQRPDPARSLPGPHS